MDMQCYKCHGYGLFAAQCPTRNLLVKGVDLDDEFEEIYKHVGRASDIDEDIRISSIQLSIIRYLHVAYSNED